MEKVYACKIVPNLDRIKSARQNGETAEKICKMIGVSVPTLRKYLDRARKGNSEYIPLMYAYDGREHILSEEEQVEQALYKACTGYTAVVKKNYKLKHIEYDSTTGKKVREWEEIVQADDEVHVPGGIMAQKFYLMNRLPERWQVKLREDGDGEEPAGVIVIPDIVRDIEHECALFD